MMNLIQRQTMNSNWKWSLNSKNKYSITTKVNGDEYEFNCNLPIRNILTYEEMIKEGIELYDLDDETNALTWLEYYKRV